MVFTTVVGAVSFTRLQAYISPSPPVHICSKFECTVLHITLSCVFGHVIQPEIIQCDNT